MKKIQHRAALAAAALLAGTFAARAAAPAGRYTVNTDTVVDTQTHLTWQRSFAPLTYTWSAATSYCQGLMAGGFPSGWRLPTKKELQSLVDVSTHAPAIDSIAFPGPFNNNYFLSSSPNLGGTGGYWAVYIVDGGSIAVYSGSVRCVR